MKITIIESAPIEALQMILGVSKEIKMRPLQYEPVIDLPNNLPKFVPNDLPEFDNKPILTAPERAVAINKEEERQEQKEVEYVNESLFHGDKRGGDLVSLVKTKLERLFSKNFASKIRAYIAMQEEAYIPSYIAKCCSKYFNMENDKIAVINCVYSTTANSKYFNINKNGAISAKPVLKELYNFYIDNENEINNNTLLHSEAMKCLDLFDKIDEK